MDSPLFQIFYSGRRVSPIREGGGAGWKMKLIPSTRSFLRLFQPLSHFVLVPPAIYIRIRFISSSCRKFVFIFRLPLSDGTSRIESAASLSFFLSSSLLLAIERNGQLSADLSTPPFQKRGVRARGSWKMKCWNVAIKNPTSPPRMFPRTRSI